MRTSLHVPFRGVPFRGVWLGLGLVTLLLDGCTTEKLVFRDPFNPPPDAASGFLG